MSEQKITGKANKDVIDEVLTRQVAAASLDGSSAMQISKNLKISYSLVRDIVASAKFKEVLEKAGEQELAPALARAKGQMARLVSKAVKAIERALDEGEHSDALKAASMVFRAVGLDEQEKKDQDTNITVVLPGGTLDNVIEVKSGIQEQ